MNSLSVSRLHRTEPTMRRCYVIVCISVHLTTQSLKTDCCRQWWQSWHYDNTLFSVINHTLKTVVNSSPLGQNGRHFTDDIFECIFLNENEWISLKISVKFVPNVRINNIPVSVQIMDWHRPGDKQTSIQFQSIFNHSPIKGICWNCCATVILWSHFALSRNDFAVGKILYRHLQSHMEPLTHWYVLFICPHYFKSNHLPS